MALPRVLRTIVAAGEASHHEEALDEEDEALFALDTCGGKENAAAAVNLSETAGMQCFVLVLVSIVASKRGTTPSSGRSAPPVTASDAGVGSTWGFCCCEFSTAV